MGSLMSNDVSVQTYVEQLAKKFEAAELFFGHGTDNAYDEAVYFTFVLLGIGFDGPFDADNQMLSEEQISLLDAAAVRRVEEHVPVAYLVGKAWFAGYEFFSDNRALVPRSPIAELIGNHFAGLIIQEPARILDMCTGSGCIGIAAALAYPEANVDLADVSKPALELADANIALHDLGNRVTTIHSDCFSAVTQSYDLILCNPPYVSFEEYAELPPEYSREPQLGLVSENNGLDLPIRLLEQASAFLAPDGVLVMEVGFSEEALTNALPELPMLWLDFANGGSGVFSLKAEQLRSFSETRK